MVDKQQRAAKPAATVQDAPIQLPQQGAWHRQLKQPEPVGELTAGEATELRTMSKLIARLDEDQRHAQLVLAVARTHLQQFGRDVVRRRNLKDTDLYALNDDTGLISRTHELVEPEVVEEPAEEV